VAGAYSTPGRLSWEAQRAQQHSSLRPPRRPAAGGLAHKMELAISSKTQTELHLHVLTLQILSQSTEYLKKYLKKSEFR